jgi:hypothetical protein
MIEGLKEVTLLGYRVHKRVIFSLSQEPYYTIKNDFFASMILFNFLLFSKLIIEKSSYLNEKILRVYIMEDFFTYGEMVKSNSNKGVTCFVTIEPNSGLVSHHQPKNGSS